MTGYADRRFGNEMGKGHKVMEDSVLEMITEYATNERLDDIVLEDGRYADIQIEIDRLTEELCSLDLTQEQKRVVDDLIAANIASGCCYTRMAYQQGFKDCVTFSHEIGLI